MRTLSKVGAGALSASLASAALLGTGVGTAFAQDAPAPCDPNKYPPVQCVVVGGNRAGAPPLLVNRTIGSPGAPITVTQTGACDPGAVVTLSLLRIATTGDPVEVARVTADAEGDFTIDGAIPADTRPGVFILYTSCLKGGFTSVSTTSFVVVAGQPQSTTAQRSSGSAATSSGSAAATTTTAAQDAAVADAALRAADIPMEWIAPARFAADREAAAAITRAVNLRLAALRSALPAAEAAAPKPTSSSPVDVNPWAAGAAGAAFLLVGAAGWRRHAAASATTDEVAQ